MLVPACAPGLAPVTATQRQLLPELVLEPVPALGLVPALEQVLELELREMTPPLLLLLAVWLCC